MIEGLKRRGAQDSPALKLLCEIYLEDLSASGLEHELCSVLLEAPAPGARFDEILHELRARDKIAMGNALIRAATDEGFYLDWPPEPAPKPQALEISAPDSPEASAKPPEPKDKAPAEPKNIAPERAPAAPATAPEPPSPAKAPSPRATAQALPKPSATARRSGPRRPGRRRLRTFTLAAIILLICAALTAWLLGLPGVSPASLKELDRSIERSDPADRDASRALFEQGDEPPIAERKAFVRAVTAAEWGERSAAVASAETGWGIGAQAISAALQGELADALSAATRLEREYPGSLAAMWVKGFVEEARGQLAPALKAYLEGASAYPKFVPFLSAQFRIAARQGQGEALQELQDKLRNLSEKNPYASVTIKTPTLEDLERPSLKFELIGAADQDNPDALRAETSLVERPKFARALSELQASLKSIEAGDLPEARSRVERALEHEPALGPALMLAGVLRAADLELEAADVAWARLSEIPGLSSELRWSAQIAAPLSLSGAGRPDLALQYAVQLRGLGQVDPREIPPFFRSADDEDEPAHNLPAPRVPILSVEEKLKDDPLAQQALLARAEVLSQLGLGRAANETLELLDGVEDAKSEQALAQAIVALRQGRRREMRLRVDSLGDSSPQAEAARALLALHTGEYERAVKHAKAAREERDSLRVLRAHTLALAALERGRSARGVLQDARVSPLEVGGLRALAARIAARLGSTRAERPQGSSDDFDAFIALQPTSLELFVDLAHVAFWQQDFAQARALAESALQVAPDYPAAHWIKGLVSEAQAQAPAEQTADRPAIQSFAKAWRDEPREPHLLMELGEIYLNLEEAPRAQQAFYRALLRDRQNLAAIDGLGQAYLVDQRRRGVRDLSRILAGYSPGGAHTAQRVKILKWLAILEGSREGKEQGLAHLQRAIKEVGESAELLVELAHFEQAAGEAERARKLYARALKKDSTLAEARLGIAKSALKTGDTAAAKSQLRRYLQLSPPAAQAQWARQTLEELSEEGEDKTDPTAP